MTATKKTKERLRGKKTLKVGNFLNEFEKDDIKSSVDIVSLFNHFGITLNKKGKSFSGHCPWHEDKTPSLSVDKEKGLYNCFGCGEAGDVFTLTEKMKGVEFKDALIYLKDFIHTHPASLEIPKSPALTASRPRGESTSSEGVPAQNTAQNDNSGRDAEPLKAQAMSLTTVADYYHKRLLENDKALRYLKSRGFNGFKIITRFQLGFADGSIHEKISTAQKENLTELGVLSEKEYEHFKNCITFPIVSVDSSILGMYGRSINAKAKVPHLYLKGKHQGVFNRKASKVYDEIILTECIIDALSFIQLGIENTQSLYGTNGLTDEHIRILKDDRVKTVVLALDNDQAGESAAAKLKEKLLTEGFIVKIIIPPEVKDWNEFLVNGGSAETIKDLITNTEIFKSEESENSLFAKKDSLGYVFTLGDISYRVTGAKEVFVSNLRVNMKATDKDTDLKYYDNLDLYSARSRSSYASNMARTLDIEPGRVEKDLIAILEYLETVRDRYLNAGEDTEEERELSPYERDLGMSLLKSPEMFADLVEDMTALGYVGEDINKQLMYIAASSIKLDDPISILITSQSASGKSYLVDTVKELIPPEYIVEATSLSDQALNYVSDLEHKFLILSEAVHKDVVEHQLREMVSAKQLSRMVVVKDPQTGTMQTQSVKTKAIVSTVMSTTSRTINPENASRCFIIETDESVDQTRKIHERQREKHTLNRILAKEESIPLIIEKHHAAQRLLTKRVIVNNIVKHIDFPATVMRTRRDHDRFIDLMASICYLRQYQKEIKSEGTLEYIECDLEDYEVAHNILVKGVLNTILVDIPKSAKALYDAMRDIAQKEAAARGVEVHEVRLTQREIRERSSFGQSWVKQNMRILIDYEYVVVVHGGTSRSKGFYRIKADEPMEECNLSMIPTPEELIKEIQNTSTTLSTRTGQTGQKLGKSSLTG